jgi:hypothetical protein
MPVVKGGDTSVPEPVSTQYGQLEEARTHAQVARQIITGFARTYPSLATTWQQLQDSVSDVPILADQIVWLRRDLAEARLGRANLAAAGRVTLTAWRNNEDDPLSYLRDELAAQGFAGRSA